MGETGSANSVSRANGFKTGSETDEYKCRELDVSPNARSWFEGEMSIEMVLHPSIPKLTWKRFTCGVLRVAVSTN